MLGIRISHGWGGGKGRRGVMKERGRRRRKIPKERMKLVIGSEKPTSNSGEMRK